jgi:hypothetical protein
MAFALGYSPLVPHKLKAPVLLLYFHISGYFQHIFGDMALCL